MEDRTSIDRTSLSAEKLELLALLLEEEGFEESESAIISRRPNPDQFPISFAQERLWFLDQVEPGTPAYNIPLALQLTGQLKIEALAQSLTRIVERHEVLRATFSRDNGRPVQRIAPAVPTPLPVVSVEGPDRAARRAAAHRILEAEAQRPFDLQHGPLLRATLLRLADDEHILLLVLHHIVSDGWSTGVLLQELTTCYTAFSAGQLDRLSSELPPLVIQYADYAAWERDVLNEERLAAQRAYWAQQLAGAPAVLTLPTDRPRPAVLSSRGAIYRFQLPASLTAELNRLSQQEGATLFQTLLATFQVLLGRLTQQTDVVVGTPIAHRTRRETEALIGCFINTLALRADLSGNPSFRALLQQVRATTLAAYEQQDLPFAQVVDALQLARDLSYTPLFQTLFVLQNARLDMPALPGLDVRLFEFDRKVTQFDFTLTLDETPQGLEGMVEYSADLFDAATIARVIDCWRQLLAGVVANPAQPIAALPLLTAADRQTLLAFNPPAAAFPVQQCLHQRFAAQAARTPDAIAVTAGPTTLRYGALEARANQLAHQLRALGVGPDTLVGLYVERSAALVVALLATLKAGAAYLPLDPSYPAERLQFMAADAGVRVVLTETALQATAPTGPTTVLALDAWDGAAWPTTPPAVAVTPDHLAYVIYTSGSTGTPKGTLISHANVMRLFAATDSWFNFSERDVWTLFHSFAFDFSVWELWGALLYGGRLVVVPYLTSRSPQAFYNLLCEQQVTVLNQTPSAFRQLIQADERADQPAALALRLVIFGGEALELASVQPWFARHGDQRPQLVNMYGITETTVHVTYRPLTLADTQTAQGSVIGRPIPDLQVYVLDQQQQLAPIGAPGEMYVGGTGLARGYLNRPALTAERFVPDPFSTEPGARLYRSGDLARYRADGGLEYLGRIDQQVKIRGFRVELGEIETALAQHPAVREAVVLYRTEAPAAPRLVAYCVPQTTAPALDALRAFLQTRLPEYMVPAAFVFLAELPLTANGKLNRNALPAPDGARPELAAAYVAPRTPAEAGLAEVWAEVLGLDRVGIHDNFFALGGDSIRSVQVSARAEARGLPLSLQQLLRYQTVSTLAEAITQQPAHAPSRWSTTPFSLISDQDRSRLPADVEDAYPLTMLQSGMIYHMSLMPERLDYHNVNSYYLRAPFDADAFHTAVQQVVRRHPVLRTTFDLISYSQPLQLVHAHAELATPVEDLRHLTQAEQEAAIISFAKQEAQRPFDLSRAPLIRFFIHRRTDETFQFTLTEFHPIVDGWSLHTILAEIFELHFALLQGAAPALPPVNGTFRDFVAAERASMQSEDSQRFWADQLRDASVTQLPRWPEADRPAAAERIQRVEVPITAQLSQRLQQLANTASAPLKSVLLTAHLRVLSLLSGQSDVLTGLVSNGRPEQADVEQICGLFLNTLPFRLQLRDGSWLDLIRQTFDAECAVLPFRRYPLAAMQQGAGRAALFEVVFNYVNFHGFNDLFHSNKLEYLDFSVLIEPSNFTLQVGFGVDPISSAVTLKLEYDTAILCERQVQALGGYYQAALTAMAERPTERHTRASLLAADELHELVIARNATAAGYPQDMCIHALVEAQVARTPDAIAVRFQQHELSYRTFDQRANHLAHLLQQRGVRPGDCVGICVERSVELMIGLLGILKAGAAFVPLDPAFPEDRLQFMLEDAGITILLTQSYVEPRLPGAYTGAVIRLDDPALLAAQPVTPCGSRVTADGLAYMIYTSGSTGRPKGVLISHRAFVNYLHWCAEAYTAAAGCGAPVHASIAADAIFPSVFAPLVVGTTVTVMPEEQPLERLAQLLAAGGGFSMAKITPTQLDVLNQLLPRATADGWVRTLVVGAEALRGEVLRFWQQHAPATTLLNEYGPTETVVGCSIYQVPGGHYDAGPVPMGLPIANMQFYVLDDALQLTPIGGVGELYIGGDGVAWGYHHRAALTAEKFVPDPFSAQPGARLYRTGDLVRVLPDRAANIEFVGRIDDQIKLRGYRIEPGEIEAALVQHPAVREAVVLVREDVPGHQQLVAYVVGKEPESSALGSQLLVLGSELRTFLRERLPEYMVPAVFVPLAALPLTTTGKLNRRALPAPELSRPELAATYVAPRTPAETTLAAIWADVLGLERVGVADSFFELGGDSILSIRVVAQANAQGLPLTMKQMVQHPTIAALADELAVAPSPAIDQAPVSGDVALTPIQRWFFERWSTTPERYTQLMLLRSRESLDPAALRQVIQDLVQRHDALRLRYERTATGWRQYNAASEEHTLFVEIDLSHVAEAEQRAALEATAGQLQARIDLADGPLVQLALIDLGPDTPQHLLLVIHHLAVDNVSWQILLDDLQTLYQQLKHGLPAQLPPKTTSFQEWAALLTAYAQTDAARDELDYWLRLPVERSRPLPVDQPAGDRTIASAASVSVELSVDETTTLLRDLPQLYQTQINDVLLTALARACAPLTGALLVDLQSHGRANLFEQADLSRTVGWFTATYPVVLDLADAGDPAQALLATKAQLRQIPHGGIGYSVARYLREDAALRERLGRIRQPEIIFNYLGQLNQQASETALFRLIEDVYGSQQDEAQPLLHLLEVTGFVAGGRLQLSLTYSRSAYQERTIASLADRLGAALRELLALCQAPALS